MLGAGLLGTPIIQRLQEQQLNMIAWNRTPSKLATLQGVDIAQTPTEAIAQAEVVLLLLTDISAIEAVLLTEAVKPQLKNRTIIQMGTIAPDESRQLAQQIQQLDGDYFEAPVLGSIPEAKSGQLIIMVGGTAPQLEKWQFIFNALSQQIHHIGPIGSAAALKLALNQLIASLTAAFSLSLGLVQKNAVSVETFMDILRQSALYAKTFDKKLPNMTNRQFDNPNFPLQHLLKDVNLILQEAQRLDLNTAACQGIQQILQNALSQGLAEQDYSALFTAVVPREVEKHD